VRDTIPVPAAESQQGLALSPAGQSGMDKRVVQDGAGFPKPRAQVRFSSEACSSRSIGLNRDLGAQLTECGLAVEVA
jgi:hypothetical protein